MPSIRYMNQSAPFWDFIASLEQQGTEHPMFGNRNRGGESSDEEAAWSGPQGWGWGPWGWPGAHRGWQQGPPPYPDHHHDGPAPPPEHEGPPPPSAPPGEPADPPESVPHPGPPPHGEPEHGPRGRHGRHGHHGPGHGPHGDQNRRGGRCGMGRGGFRGPWGRRGMGAFNMSALSDFIQSQMMEASGNDSGNNDRAQDFKPEADIFDTEMAFVVHVSLPGAKKEDVAVNWDAEKSELSIGGVIHRPGDEEFLKTLALDERKIGAFERKIRLGSRANPAQVDVDGISARFEDGILIVNVPKEDKDFVEVKKVDIE